jgi:hypothetical protein
LPICPTYEGIDSVRSEEVTRKVGESLLPALRKLPGFGGCYVFDESKILGLALRPGRRLKARSPSIGPSGSGDDRSLGEQSSG